MANPRDPAGRGTAIRRHRSLSTRQRDILELLAAGFEAKEISLKLEIAATTLTTHTFFAQEKLGASGRAHAIALAVASGEVAVPVYDAPRVLQPLIAPLETLRGPSGQLFFPNADAQLALIEALTE